MTIPLKLEPHLPKRLLQWKPIKRMKNASYFMLEALSVIEMFAFLSWLFVYVEKWLDKKVKADCKTYDATEWTTNNYL